MISFKNSPSISGHQLRANNACPESVYEANFFTILVFGNENVLQRERNGAQIWLEQSPAGRNWAGLRNVSLPLRLPPERACDATTPRPRAEIFQPTNGSEVINVVAIQGSAMGPNYSGYQLDYGLGYEPGGWGSITGMQPFTVDNGWLANWDTTQVNSSGPVTVRLLIYGPDNPFTAEHDPVYLERRTLLNLVQPTATPTPTPYRYPDADKTPTPTETPTATATEIIFAYARTDVYLCNSNHRNHRQPSHRNPQYIHNLSECMKKQPLAAIFFDWDRTLAYHGNRQN